MPDAVEGSDGGGAGTLGQWLPSKSSRARSHHTERCLLRLPRSTQGAGEPPHWHPDQARVQKAAAGRLQPRTAIEPPKTASLDGLLRPTCHGCLSRLEAPPSGFLQSANGPFSVGE